MKPGLIEMQGIDIVPEADRTAKPRDLFWPWFAANISVFGISYGSFLLGFGISFWQATIVAIVGITLSFLLCGLIAVAGKRGSAPTMILSRAAFGVHGQKVPGIISWLTSIGWETFLAIMAVLATSTVIEQLGGSGGTVTKIIATVIVAALIVAGSILGYHTIMKLQSVLTWLTGGITVLYILLSLHKIHWPTVAAIESGNLGQVLGATMMMMTGFGLGWINIAADWTRYQSRDARDRDIIFWNTFGGAVAPVLLVIFGVLLVGSNPEMQDPIAGDPIGSLATILPTWILVPFLICAVLSLVSGAINGIYSSGLTLLSLGIKIPRPAAAAIDGTILTLGTLWVVFFATNFINPFQSFLITLGVPLAAWAGILIADIYTRRTEYDEPALFDANGRYGSFDWASIAIFVVFTIIGWGLVINQFDSEAPWNSWQGYLMGLIGGKDGDWAYANVGVVVALVGSWLVAFIARRGIIRRQEEGLSPVERGA